MPEKTAQQEYMNRYYLSHKDKWKAAARKYWLAHKTQIVQSQRTYRMNHPIQVWVSRTLNKHKTRGNEIIISSRELYIICKNTVYCPLCKAKLEWVAKKGLRFHDNAPSLDRIENGNTLTKDNCWIICWRCNVMKGSLSIDEFIERCKVISQYKHEIKLEMKQCPIHKCELTGSPYDGDDTKERDFCPECEEEWEKSWSSQPINRKSVAYLSESESE